MTTAVALTYVGGRASRNYRMNARSLVVAALLSACVSEDASVSDASFVYVSNEDSNDISVIDARGDTVVATLPVGKRPRGILLSPDGRTVYVALSGSPKASPGIDE